ncbi:hypothetical protein [Tenacibaculum discolor]|uniref:hypothetical protein n=1 Tax=Tenacibaculum discolor TaxID=361581 RepID=UPI000F2CDE9B|nr:hypothetical protein [Tenacibaculum discolor]RLK07049.1 hypothetical protein C8N27_0622 [Tenacibaculum discolor]
MKKSVLIIVLMFLSCSKAIDKKYQEDSEFENLMEIKKDITYEDYKILKWQLYFLKSKNSNIKKTYAKILSEGQVRWNDTLKKREKNRKEKQERLDQEHKKEQERIKQEQEEFKKELTAKICNRKWGIYYYKPDHIEINPDLEESSKKIAETAFKWNPKHNWILFKEDGTCTVKDIESNNTYTKRWHITDRGIFLPSGWQYERTRMSMSEITLEIINLNNTNFDVIEIEIFNGLVFKSEMKMKKIK